MGDVGYGFADITPPVGVALAGFAARADRPSSGVDDPLFAQAIAFRDERRIHLLVSLDLLGLDADITGLCRSSLIAALPTDDLGARALITCTHTHSGPVTLALVGESRPTPEYLGGLAEAITRAALEAVADLRPATMSVGSIRLAGLIRNRRAPFADGGPVDETLTILAWTSDRGDVIAGAVHLGCHAVATKTQRIGSDLAGNLARAVGSRLGGRCLFLQGAAGNVNPIVVGQGHTEMLRWVDDAMEQIGDVRRCLQPTHFDAVQSAERTLAIPFDPLPPRKQILARLRLIERATSLESSDGEAVAYRDRLGAEHGVDVRTPVGQAVVLHHLDNERQMERRILAAIDAPNDESSSAVALAAWRLGGIDLAFASVEAFVETSYELRRSMPGRHVLQVSYLAPLIGYLPTAAAKMEGGYESAVAWRYYGHPAGWVSHAEAMVRAEWLDMFSSFGPVVLTGRDS